MARLALEHMDTTINLQALFLLRIDVISLANTRKIVEIAKNIEDEDFTPSNGPIAGRL